MRPVREITTEEENFRLVDHSTVKHSTGVAIIGSIRRDPIQPEPIGTIILKAFKITGYRPDCDGSLMAEMENIDYKCKPTGWEETSIGLYPTDSLVVTQEELKKLFKK